MRARVAAWLIPAHAGKTYLQAPGSCGSRAHPRSRGENLVDKPNVLAHLGSSPLTRGKRHQQIEKRIQDGLIPAHAGKTGVGIAVAAYWGAHPRSRGENSAPASAVLIAWGSSPLTRGKRPGLGLLLRRSGLIPAHAGKT